MSILLLGGSGLLGTELQKIRKYDFVPSRKEFDILSTESMFRYLSDPKTIEIDLIVNCAAYTKVEQAEIDKTECYKTNVVGVRNLVQFLQIPILHISTAYVFDGRQGNYKPTDPVNPINYYSLTKALAEEVVLSQSDNVIVRTLFKPRPWPFWQAYIDQITTGLYVDDAAKKIDRVIDLMSVLPKIVHIGGKYQTIYELARETRNVSPMFRQEVHADLPRDVSLDCSETNL